MGLMGGLKSPTNPFKKKSAEEKKQDAEQLERIAKKEKEHTIARLGLKPEDADATVTSKERPVQRDTRKKTVKTIKVKPAGGSSDASSPSSPQKKRKKKKKTKLDPKGEYARLKELEEAALAKDLDDGLETLEMDSSGEWHDCVRCMEDAQLRTLIGDNGEYLCHSCYWSLHSEVARREQMGDEAHEKEVPEGEECRSCLDQGYLRRCCNEFYCHKCYLRTGYCPGCNQKNNTRGLGGNKEDPGIYWVMSTWALSTAYVFFIFIMTLLVVYNEYHLPETIWGYKCYGFFPKCDMDICVDLGGEPREGIKSASEYQFCDLQNTVNKIRGKVCVYDEELFKQSKNTLGYDFCYDTKDGAQQSQDEFKNGVYVFEDNFDYWKNKTDYSRESILLASANWATMTNAQVTDFCGVNQLPGDKNYPAIGPDTKYGEGALVFSGVIERQAVTVPLDMRNGGTVNFHLKFAPIVENEDDTRCKTAFGGDVHLEYSVDLGESWVKFGSYIVHNFRYETFGAVEEEIPLRAYSNQTMFKWDQPYFEDKRDYWALDDIVIFHRFDGNWRDSGPFLEKKADSDEKIQVAQCCFETEQCENNPSTFLNEEEDCAGVEGWTEGRKYVLRGADAYVIIASLLALCKFTYNFAVLMLTDGDVVIDKFLKRYMPRSCRRKKTAAMFDFQQKPDDEPPPGMLAEGSFQCVCHPKFRKIMTIVFLAPWVIAQIWMMSVTGGYTVYQPFVSYGNEASAEESTFADQPAYVEPDGEATTSSGFVVFLCMTMDMANIFWLSKHVFCLWPAWVPEVSIDTNPRNNWLRVGKQKIVLTDVKEIHRFSKRFCQYVTVLYILGGMPWCSITMICKGFWFTYEKARVVEGVFGFLACFRAFFGAAVFAKFHFAMEFILSLNNDARDDMGLSMRIEKVRYLAFYCFLAVSVSVGLIISTYYYHSKTHSFFSAIICGIFGAIYGTALGLLQGLPTQPQFFLTRWPDEGHTVQYEKKIHCPCIFYCAYCSDMHTRQGYLVLFLDNMQSYQELLKGDVGGQLEDM
ncbi:hypothetical protein TrLO_g6454 [Triparma laevis f. longispina]|uniref:Reelin n=1 Tax=Triparma laevis f. longispina TaxID=1714387 RepID=A0A9W6ZZ34_9STRA|nr:hypothetical protein TrLO_g6454 [Triparma laevis f. longispina]